jgi:hypothetical protein
VVRQHAQDKDSPRTEGHPHRIRLGEVQLLLFLPFLVDDAETVGRQRITLIVTSS